MPRFQPFPGLRYDLDRITLGEVVCPPYDVITPDERAELAARSPLNAVHVELPEGSEDRYEQAAAMLKSWESDGALLMDPTPSFYRSRMTTPDGRSSSGVMGALGVGDPDVLPHEQTMRKAKTDRLDLLRATRTNLSPIWALSLGKGLTTALGDEGAAIGDAVDDDGVRHQLWRIDDEDAVRAIQSVVEAFPLVIADGHHRYETARNFREEDPASDHILCLITELSADQLMVGPIHRTLSGANGDLLEAFHRWFDPEPGACTLVTSEGRWPLTPKARAYEAAGSDLDSSIVALVLDDLSPQAVGHPHSEAEAMAALEDGSADAAVLLRPATVAQISAWAEARRLMPPKTTYFSPKPRTGMVFRSL